MTGWLRKLMLTAHVVSSVGWLGAVGAFLALAIAGVVSRDAQAVRAAYLGMRMTTWLVIVPLSIASPLTGIVQSLGTPRGLFRHYWVLIKFLITIPCTAILLFAHMKPIDLLAQGAALNVWPAELRQLQIHSVVAAGAALVVLLVLTALSVYKPAGTTSYGARSYQQAARSQA